MKQSTLNSECLDWSVTVVEVLKSIELYDEQDGSNIYLDRAMTQQLFDLLKEAGYK